MSLQLSIFKLITRKALQVLQPRKVIAEKKSYYAKSTHCLQLSEFKT